MNLNLEEFNRLTLDSFDPDSSDEPNLRQILVGGFSLLGNTLERIAVNQLLDVEIPKPDFDTLKPGCTKKAIEFIRMVNHLEYQLATDASDKIEEEFKDPKSCYAVWGQIEHLLSPYPEALNDLNKELKALISSLDRPSQALVAERLLEVEKFRIKVLRFLLSNACQGNTNEASSTTGKSQNKSVK
jgi:hypothetical protein